MAASGGGGAGVGPAADLTADERAASSSQAEQEAAPSATVTVRFRGRELAVARGTKLRTALLEAGLTPHNGRAQLINCRGLGTCGTCAVEISGPVQPGSWTTAEQLRLNFPPHCTPANERLRLACQVACAGDMAVTKHAGFWGQRVGDGPPVADAADGELRAPPLGALEYVLDPSRRFGGAGGGGGGPSGTTDASSGSGGGGGGRSGGSGVAGGKAS